VIYLEIGTWDLEIVWKLKIENWKLKKPPKHERLFKIISN